MFIIIYYFELRVSQFRTIPTVKMELASSKVWTSDGFLRCAQPGILFGPRVTVKLVALVLRCVQERKFSPTQFKIILTNEIT